MESSKLYEIMKEIKKAVMEKIENETNEYINTLAERQKENNQTTNDIFMEFVRLEKIKVARIKNIKKAADLILENIL